MKHHGVKRSLAIFVSILMVLSVFPFGALTAFAENGAAADDWASLQAAFNEGGTVTLSGDVTAPAGAAALTVPSRTRVTLYLNGCTVDRTLTEETEKGSVIIVSGELDVFGPGTITGGNTSGSGGGLWVKRGGSVVLDEDVVVSGNHAKYTGGGVYVSGSNASFSMMDGTSVTNNSAKNGGGLAQDSTGCISVFSGSICNNTAENNGGGVWYGGGSGAALNLLGGEISGNTAGNDGGGVYANRSVFSMSESGSIINNTAGHSGGGVFFGGDVFVPDGTISGNTAPTDPEIGAKDANSIPSYTITVSGAIVGGIVAADKASAKYGEAVTLTATPASEDYVLDNLTVTGADGSTVALTGNTFVMPPTDVTVTATFREKREFRVETQDYDSSTDHGRVYLEDFRTDAWIYEGDTVTAFAIPDSGLIATSWTVLMQDELSGEYIYAVPDVSHPTPNTISFTMPSADVLISATFSESHDQRLVFINDMEGGTVVSDKTLVGPQDDEQVTLTILPGNGYRYVPDSLRLMDVDRDNGSQLDITPYMTEITENSVYSIYIGSGDLYVYADFERVPEQPKHCVVVDGETDNGTISADYDLAEEGWTVKVTANPDAFRGYAVKSVTVTDEDGATYPVTALGYNEYKFTMPATDVFVTAEFGIPVYAITTDCPSAAATGCELETDEEAEAGDDVAVWVTAFDEFLLESLTVTGDSTGANYPISLDYHRDGSALYRYKFTMPGEPVTVSAVFGTMKYALTVNEAVEGAVTFTVDGEAATEAAYGESVNVTYVYENKAGTYEDLVDSVTYAFTMNGATARRPLDDLTIADGTCTGTFTMPAAPVEIGASYVSPYTVSLAAVQDGSIEAWANSVLSASTIRVYPGEVVGLRATSSLSEKVSAEWRVTYTDETGEHSAPVTRISDREAQFVMPIACVTVSAELTPLGVPYMARSWNSADKSVTEQLRYYTGEYTNVSSITNDAMTGGWYVLDGNLTFENRITVSGSVRLILTDGMTLTAEEGIRVPEGATLSVYGQANDSGKLIAGADGNNAAIGSNDEDDGDENGAGTIIIYGGTIEATGDSDAAGIGGGNEAHGGFVTVYGGTVTATGGDYGAGIGTGDEFEGVYGSVYTFYGGTVTANGGEQAAGIGGGNECDGVSVTIWGGTINAKGDHYDPLMYGIYDGGAGIGGGDQGNGGTIAIHGGTVTATGGNYGAGIGGGNNGNAGNITITDGTVTATGGDCGAGIGTGYGLDVTTDLWVENSGSVTISGGKVTATGGGKGAGVGGGSHAGGVTIKISGGEVTATGGSLADECAAGIGSGHYCGTNALITISGGTVTAIGGYAESNVAKGGAGIGTGSSGDMNDKRNGKILITGGEVTAIGGQGAAGVGGGYKARTENIEITGGVVNASSRRYDNRYAPGIGRGYGGATDMGNILITGGTVTARNSADSGDPKAFPIGRDPGDASASSLTLGANMNVRTSAEEAPVNALDRIVTAVQSGRKTIVISECDHPQATYTATADTHLKHCAYCYTAFTAGDHTFAGEDHVCSVCGYQYGGALYTVSFDANGGSGETSSVTVIPGSRFDLPACDFTAPAGKTFGGWSIAIDGGTVIAKVGDPITVDGDTIVSAVWEDILYPVNVEDTQYGAVTADKETAAMGEPVTLTVTPMQGFRLASLTVTDENSGAVEVVDGSFTMPIGGATVSAVFEIDPDIVNANVVKDLIEAVGEVEYTDESKNKIDAAETAYDALTDAQKALVTNYETLTAARNRYAELKAAAEQAAADREAADAVEAKIDAIGSVEYTDACKAKIDEARDAYDALTDAQKALVENYDELEGAEAAYAYLKAEAEATQADHTAAAAVKEKIYDIGTVEYTEACKVKIDEARDAYDALTDTQKALVTNYETLTAAEASYAALKAAADQAAADQAAADAVIEKINAIGEVEYTAESKAKIDDARTAYNGLTQTQKALVENFGVLEAAEARYADLKADAEQTAANQAAANAVIGKINAIGTVEYTETCKAKIDDAQNAYDALTDAQKVLVTNVGTLTAAQARYAELKAAAEQAAADQAAADAVIAKIDAIGTVEYTNASKAKIDGARTAYNGLTQTQKALVANYGVLEAAEARYAELKAAAEAPTNPDQPSGGSGKCKWCGEDHSANFWQRIVGFWHTIFYFWAHLFGLR